MKLSRGGGGLEAGKKGRRIGCGCVGCLWVTNKGTKGRSVDCLSWTDDEWIRLGIGLWEMDWEVNE